ncbi:MAG: hypothetical protein DCC67_08525 [Planctomycetota bacterium]|nr:MAG: hypothetical protein DCC67_08525 [Planctomycetota bacterium]
MHAAGLLAIDVGSSRVKLGWFPAVGACNSDKPAGSLPIAAPLLPQPQEGFEAPHRDCSPETWLGEIERWLEARGIGRDARCSIASVHAAAGGALEEHLRLRGFARLRRLNNADVPIVARVAEPGRVGIDRLLGALAASRLRSPGAPAISVDMGTAITVDLIAADGGFEGGAILAGPDLSLAALHGGTSTLPRLAADVIDKPPEPVGKSTAAALASGAYWGAVGARLAAECPAPPELFLTGGAARRFAPLLRLDGKAARCIPHLVLSGIQLAAAECRAS